MPVREVCRYPDPVLRRICDPVDAFDEGLAGLVTDLVDTLQAMPGCVGIAAPQIGIARRVVVIDASRHRRPVPHHGLLVLVNPVVAGSSGREVGREGCLSLPDYTANVARATEVTVRYATAAGPVALETAGFEAVVVQHELDHLEGILFIDRVTCLKTDLFRRKSQGPRRNN